MRQQQWGRGAAHGGRDNEREIDDLRGMLEFHAWVSFVESTVSGSS